MKVRHCPRCRGHRLFQTGAFWACADCGYWITQSALAVDEARSAKNPIPSVPSASGF